MQDPESRSHARSNKSDLGGLGRAGHTSAEATQQTDDCSITLTVAHGSQAPVDKCCTSPE